MKRNRIFLNTLLGAMALGVLATGCKDDFTEEDLLEKNIELAEQQEIDKTARLAESLNTAGELLSYSVKVVSSNNQPVAGANVTLKAGGQAEGENDSQTLTTDANGEAFFGRAVIGGNTLSISAEGYFDVIASVDFGTIDEGEHYQIIDGLVVPTPVTESSIIPLFSDASGDDTATISGVVSIETDLTNTVPEVPQDLTLRANLSNFANQFNVEGSVNLEIYTFDNDVTIGSAVVDNATGAYSMTVPATPDGIYVSVLVPNVSAEQRVAITSRNGFDLDRPEYAQVVTNFGPDWGSDYSIPYVPGAIWVFDEPQGMAGAGFDFTYTRLGRSLTTGTFKMDNYQVPGELFGGGITDIIVQTTNLGSGYIDSPSFTIEDPTGTGAAGQAHIEFAIDGLQLTTSGSPDFPANSDIDFHLVFDQVFHTVVNGEVVQDVNLNTIWDFDFLTVQSTDLGGGVGEITQTAVENALAAAIANDMDGFNPDDLYGIGSWVSNLRLVSAEGVMEEAVIHVSSMAVSQVYEFGITHAGNGYTDPTFGFSGGGAAEQANLDVLQFGTRWIMEPDNSGVTTPYTTLPLDISYEYIPVNTGYQYPNVDDEVSDADFDNDTDLLSALEVDANGNIQFKDQLTELFATDNRSHEMPRTLIEEPESAIADVYIYDIDVDENGGITDYDFNVPEYGEGYTSQFTASVQPAAEGGPGSGAQVNLTGGAFTTSGEYEWYGGYEIKSVGSDYLDNLNQQQAQGYSGYFNDYIESGQEYFFNIRYGTGVKQEDVD